ncbi:MAG TPA: 4-hydroxybenzoate octaprenyltransferase [Gammaproteobacteria bacterium]|nr:4-hydroxybenzoate octaprenyltransferase [Gammaproteobacteria bacterium]
MITGPGFRTQAAALALRGLHVTQRLLHELGLILDHYSKYARLMRLHRPIGIWLLLWPTLWALWIASAGRPDPKVFLVFVLGTIVVRSAGCIINDYADRNLDPHVRRTADRPLASGEIAPAEALILFAALMLIALGLVMTLSPLTVWVAAAGAAITVLYPFMKRFMSAPQFVLGVAFGWGVPMAYAAETGGIPRIGALLFLSAIIWGVVYDTEYAMVDRDDDLDVGIRSTAILFGDMDRVFIAGLHGLLFLSLLLVGKGAELGAWYYGGLAVGFVFALYQMYLIRDRDPAGCFRAFLNNAWLGGAVFVGIALDFTFRSAPPA